MHGLVVGRFYPPHAGHIAMIRTAAALVERLTIAVCYGPEDMPSGALRERWLAELVPDARLIVVASPGPSEPGADPRALAAILQARMPERTERLFASDPEHAALAAALDARLILIDPAHAALPVRSAQVRADPWAHWDLLPSAVRAYFARSICLHGPESTGKSTLAPKLAAHFDTFFVPEYGRTYCEQNGTDLAMRDLVAIGQAHAAMTQALLRKCNRRLIVDTDPLMTAVWADMLFGTRDPWFDRFDQTADLYLLLDIDLPWIDDGTRLFGGASERRRFFDLSLAELERRGLPYRIIGGPAGHRLAGAIEAIREAGLG